MPKETEMPKEQAYLDEMQIDCWELLHPERLSGYEPELITLSDSCSLLLIAPVLPQGGDAEYLSKVLASIKLSTNQALHVYPQQLATVDFSEHTPKWIWFAGCEPCSGEINSFEDSQVLSSPPLNEISDSTLHRRTLWQQICSYESN